MKFLTDAGWRVKSASATTKPDYEHHYDHQHHDHMICTEMRLVIDFFSPALEEKQDEMADKYKFVATHHSLRIWGVCEKCQESEVHSVASGAQPRVRVKTTIFHKEQGKYLYKMNEIELKFERENRDGIAVAQSYLIDAARRLGVEISCERLGLTDDCAVTIKKGGELLSKPTKAELEVLSDKRRKKGERLACQTKLEKNGEIWF